MKKDFLSIADLTAEEIWQVIHLSLALKNQFKQKGQNKHILSHKSLVMLFEKPSLRTKLSFDMAIKQLGGEAIYFGPKEVGLGGRESIKDVAYVVSSMGDIVMARTFLHKTIEELAKYSPDPVINGLSDLEHPCQILADLLTIYEIKNKLSGLKLAYIGDGENNVTHSLVLGCALMGIDFVCASPSGYFMDPKVFVKAKEIAFQNNTVVDQVVEPLAAAEKVDIVYTDTWVSMGEEKEMKQRLKAFSNYVVTGELMAKAKKDAIFMHDMPAHRGKEVEAAVIDGPQSVIYQQAENRLHAQKGLLVKLLGKELHV